VRHRDGLCARRGPERCGLPRARGVWAEAERAGARAWWVDFAQPRGRRRGIWRGRARGEGEAAAPHARRGARAARRGTAFALVTRSDVAMAGNVSAGSQTGMLQGPLAAWGGLALACSATGLSCNSRMTLSGSGGGGSTCMRLASGAMGGVVKTEGLYCACADYRSGPECGSIDPVSYLPVAIYALYIAMQVWLARNAETAARLIVSTKKMGNGEPIRVIRLQQLASVLAATAGIINIAIMVGPPEASAQIDVASYFVFSAFFACFIASANIIVVLIRAALAVAERREPSARERHVAELYSAVSAGGIMAASAISFWLVNMVVLALGSITLVVGLWHVVKMLDLLRFAGAGTCENDDLESASHRTKRLAKSTSLFAMLFTGSRVGLILTSGVADSPAQGFSASYYWLVFFLSQLAWYSIAFMASEIVRYAGGPAYLASRKGTSEYFAGRSSKVSIFPTRSNATSVVVVTHPSSSTPTGARQPRPAEPPGAREAPPLKPGGASAGPRTTR
jgi:hypothetical protein